MSEGGTLCDLQSHTIFLDILRDIYANEHSGTGRESPFSFQKLFSNLPADEIIRIVVIHMTVTILAFISITDMFA